MLSKTQTLITGVYRTGSEYITQLINCHPHVSATMYHVNVMRFAYGRFDPISDKENYRNAVHYLKDRIFKRYNNTFPIQTIFDQLDRISHVGYGDIYDRVMTELYLGHKQRYWAEKCQLVWREIPQFLDMMYNGRAVMILRDPRAVLASFKYFTNAPPPRYLGAVFNCLDAMETALKLKGDRRVAIHKYEDVLRTPQENISKIWKMMGVQTEYDLSDCEQSLWKNSYGKQWSPNSSFQSGVKQREFNSKKAVKGWTEKLTLDEIAFVEMICGEMMNQYGYNLSACDGDPEIIIDELKADDSMAQIYRQYEETGKGIEAFPSDPFEPANWACQRV